MTALRPALAALPFACLVAGSFLCVLALILG